MHVFVSHVVILRRLDQCKNPAGTLLNVSWKSPGNLLGWICRHPVRAVLSCYCPSFWRWMLSGSRYWVVCSRLSSADVFLQEMVEWYTAIRAAKLNRLAIAYPSAQMDEVMFLQWRFQLWADRAAAPPSSPHWPKLRTAHGVATQTRGQIFT